MEGPAHGVRGGHAQRRDAHDHPLDALARVEQRRSPHRARLPPSPGAAALAALARARADRPRHRRAPRAHRPRRGSMPETELVDLLNGVQLLRRPTTSSTSPSTSCRAVLETKRGGGQQVFSVDGYSGVVTNGSLDSLVLTELAYDDELFEQRFLDNEMLYYAHEAQDRRPRAATRSSSTPAPRCAARARSSLAASPSRSPSA
jgi:hypothetical protein